MATEFSCDPQAAALVAHDLAKSRSDMASDGSPTTDLAAPGAPLIQGELARFGPAAGQCRVRLDGAVARAASLFGRLADGTLDLEREFAARATTTTRS